MTQHARTQRRATRFSRFAVAFAVCAAVTAAPILPNAAQPAQAAAEGVPSGSLPATFATGGMGRFKDSIQWLQWADYDKDFKGKDKPNVPVLGVGEGPKEFINHRDLGDAGSLVTTCTLSNLTHDTPAPGTSKQQTEGPLVATIPGAWAGDALDNLYNVGGPGSWSDGSEVWHSGLTYPKDYVNKNQMVIGLANGYAYNGANAWDGKPWDQSTDHRPTGYNARVSVDYSCKAEIYGSDGTITNVPIQGLVFADAEASSKRYGIKKWATSDRQDEWVQATVKKTDGNRPPRWRVLDTMRSSACISKNTGKQVTTDGIVSDGGRTLRLMPSDEECVYQSGGSYSKPNGYGGPDAVMFMEGATSATITMQGAGYSAVALGLVVATDYGDAPDSYGIASSVFQPTWEGGEVRSTTDLFKVSPQARMNMDRVSPRLGAYIDAEPNQPFSADALGDDTDDATNDEDSVTLPADGIRTEPGATYNLSPTCAGAGKVAGWIDWNHNGTFDAGEKSNEAPCASGKAQLSWTVPADVVRSVDGEDGVGSATYMRPPPARSRTTASQCAFPPCSWSRTSTTNTPPPRSRAWVPTSGHSPAARAPTPRRATALREAPPSCAPVTTTSPRPPPTPPARDTRWASGAASRPPEPWAKTTPRPSVAPRRTDGRSSRCAAPTASCARSRTPRSQAP